MPGQPCQLSWVWCTRALSFAPVGRVDADGLFAWDYVTRVAGLMKEVPMSTCSK